MGKYEVTFDEYSAFVLDMDDIKLPPQDSGWGRDLRPVINVSWEDAQTYLEWLNKKVKGEIFRLPTEAEWEYAGRAGTKTVFSFGNDEDKLTEYAWFLSNSDLKTHRVGTRKPNPWGLYDMHGNVWEWVEDDRHRDYNGAPGDGRDWIDEHRGAYRVVRGGSWSFDAQYCPP